MSLNDEHGVSFFADREVEQEAVGLRLADRLRWPDGALAACERIDRPGWSVSYRSAFGDHAAGFYGTHRCRWRHDVELHGTTADDLAAAIAAHHCPPD